MPADRSAARAASPGPGAHRASGGCGVVELRQYTLRPGVRDRFVAFFEGILEPQEVGMRVLGQFRDLDRPDVFVWLRGFADMTARLQALQAFYGGPVWAAQRDTANGMLLDSDNVLLLTPIGPGPWLDDAAAARAPAGVTSPAGRFVIRIDPIAESDTKRFVERCAQTHARLRAAGGQPLATLATLHARNTFPRLPVRDGVHVIVTAARFPTATLADQALADPGYLAAASALVDLDVAPAQTLRLAPTGLSALR